VAEPTRTGAGPVQARNTAFHLEPPQLTLPKGGGAIRGLGEKLAANPVVGTGSLSVPIYASSGRSGFSPHLSLSYDSGAGNGPFGFGWSLNLPAITRKTDKGLPEYRDFEESDIFVISGSEDLVPALVHSKGPQWARDVVPSRTIYGKQYATLSHFPNFDGVSSVTTIDLLGNGTACLVWSSPLAANSRRPMRYIDLMGGQKPHLLIRTANNLGAETVVQYAPSTKFYVADKLAGTPWVTRIPFPVQVVERVETYDYVSRNRFITRYAYHHGHYDGVEREFRGFGRVDQWDTEEFATLASSDNFPQAANVEPASNVPPTLTKTWFHTGAFFGESRISRHLAQEYYSEGDSSDVIAGLTQAQLEAMLLDDTVLPTTVLLPDGSRIAWDLSSEEMREACRALRGSMLRQEIYALDSSDASDRPYSVAESNFTIEVLQPRDPDRFGVFFVHRRESIDYHYERKLYQVVGGVLADGGPPPPGAKTAADPRVLHAVTLASDPFGNVLQSMAIGYGRRYLDPSLTPADQQKQSALQCTYLESSYTLPVIADDNRIGRRQGRQGAAVPRLLRALSRIRRCGERRFGAQDAACHGRPQARRPGREHDGRIRHRPGRHDALPVL
jgi:hypothetical protein